MKDLRATWLLISVFIIMPIWYYLLYQILVRVDGSELMFFLFWIYLPASLFVAILKHIADEMEKA